MQLMPGVWLTAIQTRKFKSSYWSVLLLTALEEDTASLTALLPRVLNRGTARYPDQQRLAEALEQLYGGRISPVTVKLGEVQATGFQASFLDDPYALDGQPISPATSELLGELLLHPATKNGRLRSDYTRSEADNLCAEIRAQSNDKMRYAARRLNEEMCRGEAFAVDRLGSVERAGAIQRDELNRHWHRLLRESRVELYYCGSLSGDEAAQLWTEALMGLPRRGDFALPETVWTAHPGAVRRFTERQDVTQAKLSLGLRANARLDSVDYLAHRVANAVLGGAPSSKLFRHVREEQSLCYYAMSGFDIHKGLIGIHTGVAPERVEAAEAAILDQLHALQRGDVTAQELDAARRHLSNQLRSSLDTHAGLYGFYTDQTQSAAPVSAEDQFAALERVELEQVVRAAERWELDSVYLLCGEEDEHEEA